MVINGRTVHNLKLTEEERVLLEKKFSSFKRLPVNCPGSCRYCLWDGVLSEEGM